jgi:hypothetical protein
VALLRSGGEAAGLDQRSRQRPYAVAVTGRRRFGDVVARLGRELVEDRLEAARQREADADERRVAGPNGQRRARRRGAGLRQWGRARPQRRRGRTDHALGGISPADRKLRQAGRRAAPRRCADVPDADDDADLAACAEVGDAQRRDEQHGRSERQLDGAVEPGRDLLVGIALGRPFDLPRRQLAVARRGRGLMAIASTPGDEPHQARRDRQRHRSHAARGYRLAPRQASTRGLTRSCQGCDRVDRDARLPGSDS